MSVTVDIDPEVDARLNALASRTGKPKSVLLRQLIEGNVEDLEDYYDATDVLDRIERGEERVHGEEEARRELGLDD